MAGEGGGLTAADIRQRAQVKTANRVAGNGEPDPIDQVLTDSRKMAAASLSGKLASDAETSRIQADNERLKAEIEQQELASAKRNGTQGGASDTFTSYLVTQIERAHEQLADAMNRAQAASQALLEERLAMLNARLDEARAMPPPLPPTDPAAIAMQYIEQSKALWETIRPPPPVAAPAVSSYDPTIERFRITAENDYRNRQLEWEQKRYEFDREYQLKQEQLSREEARLQKAQEGQDRFISQTIPQVLGHVQGLIETVGKAAAANGAGQAVTSAAGQTAPATTGPAATARPAPHVPEGALSMACKECGSTIIYRPEWPGVICPGCGAEYREDAPAVRGERPEARSERDYDGRAIEESDASLETSAASSF